MQNWKTQQHNKAHYPTQTFPRAGVPEHIPARSLALTPTHSRSNVPSRQWAACPASFCPLARPLEGGDHPGCPVDEAIAKSTFRWSMTQAPTARLQQHKDTSEICPMRCLPWTATSHYASSMPELVTAMQRRRAALSVSEKPGSYLGWDVSVRLNQPIRLHPAMSSSQHCHLYPSFYELSQLLLVVLGLLGPVWESHSDHAALDHRGGC